MFWLGRAGPTPQKRIQDHLTSGTTLIESFMRMKIGGPLDMGFQRSTISYLQMAEAWEEDRSCLVHSS